MYENHRKSFRRGDHRDFGDDRYAEERARRDEYSRGESWQGPYQGGRSDFDRGTSQGDYGGRYRPSYGSTFRDDQLNQPYGYGDRFSDQSRYAYGNRNREREHWSHDSDHRGHGASSYGSGQPYGGGDGDSAYFTGQQNSWAVGSSYGSPGSQAYGADYRNHGYGDRYGSRQRDDDRGFWDRASDEVASWFGDEDAARRREQDHRGRGPKDYKRSDERIREDANDRLTEDPLVDASAVTVQVQDGEVTLNGTVDSRAGKRRAEDIVDRISGTKHVQNNLRVQAASASQYDAASPGKWTVNPSDEGGTLASATDKQAAKV